jgi:hypothetical protein
MGPSPRVDIPWSLKIDAPPSRVYSIVADYHQHHPRILPPEYFKGIRVEEGGIVPVPGAL